LPIKLRLKSEKFTTGKQNFNTAKKLLTHREADEVAAIDRWEKGET